MLETQAAQLAGRRRTEEDIKALRALVDKLPGLVDDEDEFLAVDIQFHLRLAEASHNEMLAQLLRDTMSQFVSDRGDYPVGHIDIERALRNQQDTLEAIIDGSPARIAKSIDEHLASAEEYFLGERLGEGDWTVTPARPPRVAMITGGGRGLGLACAQRLAEGGDAVLIVDRNAEAAQAPPSPLRWR